MKQTPMTDKAESQISNAQSRLSNLLSFVRSPEVFQRKFETGFGN